MKLIRNSKRKNIINFILPIIVVVLIVSYFINAYQNSFDETTFNVDNVYDHIRELSSSKYNGRLTGSEGNELALQYVENYFKNLGIEPVGNNDTYYQEFKSMVPQIDSQPIFQLEEKNGEMIEEFKLYKDYRLYTSGNGGGGRFEGDILFVDKYLYLIKPELIKDRVVVMGGHTLLPKDVEHVIENGGKGLFFTYPYQSKHDNTEKNLSIKSTASGFKSGKNILLGNLSRKSYIKLKNYANQDLIKEEYKVYEEDIEKKIPQNAGIIKGVKIKNDITFPVLESSNIIGKIDGNKKDGGYLIIGAHIDHVGSGTYGKYFPGALDNASGIGMMLELARVIKLQENSSGTTIIFAGWNAEENGINGSRYYVENPMYPLEKTQVINIDCIGDLDSEMVILGSDGDVGNIMKSKIFQYAEDKKIKTMEFKGGTGSDHQPFIEANVPAVMISDGSKNIHTYKDTIDNVSKENLEKVGAILTNYLKREIYKDTLPDYFNNVELMLLTLFILGIMHIYIVFSLNKVNSSMKILNITIEDIYYSSPFNLFLKCYYFITPAFMIFLALIFIVNLPPNFNLVFHNGEAYANLSMYLTLKKSILYIRNFIQNGLGTTYNHIELGNIILVSTAKSLKLIITTLLISFIFGISKGIFDSYRGGGKKDLRTVGTLMALSLPDVFIVLCGLLLIGYIGKNEILKQIINTKSLLKFIMPLLTLAIIPTVYISRITFIAIQEELKKGYISAAKAKGLTKFSIYMKHIFSSIVFKVIDSLPTLLTIIISNLIIVEYLFSYKGVVYNLYRFYEKNDMTSFLGLSFALGFIYIIFTMFSKLISKLINPMKREGVH